jgi:enoyl-CoA hydratase/carnithine racemase
VDDGARRVAEARALAAEMAGNSRSATRAVERLVGLAGRVPLAEGLRAEQEEITR